MKVFRAIKYRIWQASTVEQSRNFWSGWEKEETLKTCHEVGVDERLLGMTGFFFVVRKQTDDKLWKMKQQELIKELAVMFHLEQFAEDCFGKGTNVE